MNKEHIPFIPLKEDFNEYRVENGQLLKVKTVLTDVAVETLEPGKKTSRLGVKDFSIIITDVDIDVSKMEYATPEQISDVDVVGELRFTTVKESVNIYEIQKLLILIATRVDKIFMTNKKSYYSVYISYRLKLSRQRNALHSTNVSADVGSVQTLNIISLFISITF
jgi:hypothetical protein